MDWMNHLAEYMREELADSMKYVEAARNADGTDRQVLHDMAKEEYCHAKHICRIMRKHGIASGADEEAVFLRAREALEH